MSVDLAELSVPEILRLWAGAMNELKKRNVIRTDNNPVADLSEAIVFEHFGGERGSFSQKAWDIRTNAGERIQVKGIRRGGERQRRNLSAIRDSDYDSVVVVMFNADFELTNAVKFPRELVEETFPIGAHVNGRIVRLSDAFVRHPRVETLDLSAAYERISNPDAVVL